MIKCIRNSSASARTSLAGSTKMHYCINLIHDGFLPALLSFFIWSLPGALGMYGLSIGVSNIGDTLPGPVYALLSGLNASTVGIIAVAAVQLSEKAITDKITRILVLLGGAAGILYNALWYFPLLMFVAGCATVAHDYRWLHGPIKTIVGLMKNPTKRLRAQEPESIELPQGRSADQDNNHRHVKEVIAAITAAVEEAVPATVPSPRSKPGWNEECAEALGESKRLRHQHSLYHTDETWEAYHAACNRKGRVIKRALRQIHREKVEEAAQSPVLRQCGEGGPICWWLGCGYYIRSCTPLGYM